MTMITSNLQCHLIGEESQERLSKTKKSLKNYECTLQELLLNNNFYIMAYFPKQLANQMESIYGTLAQGLKMVKKTTPAENPSDSQSFQPEYHQIKKLGFKINKRKISSGAWTSLENYTYLKFMKNNRQDFQSQKARRKNKVFFRLSKILKKRTPDQCRSHHQKLQLKYKDNLDAIINQVQRKIQTCSIQDYLNEKQRGQKDKDENMKTREGCQLDERKYTCILDKGWFNIKSYGSSLKISLDPNSIQQW